MELILAKLLPFLKPLGVSILGVIGILVGKFFYDKKKIKQGEERIIQELDKQSLDIQSEFLKKENEVISEKDDLPNDWTTYRKLCLLKQQKDNNSETPKN